LLGRALIERLVSKGEKVISISRHVPDEPKAGVLFVPGDILQDNLGIKNLPYYLTDLGGRVEAVYHLAGIINLGPDKDGSVWTVNTEGTKKVVEFCLACKVPHLFYCSTAFTHKTPYNAYEASKVKAEETVSTSHIPSITIFKPSIIIGDPEQHFSQFVTLMIRMHHRAEVLRRIIETSLMLPVLQPVFRLRGNPEGKLNILPVDDVARGIAEIKQPGTFWLTHDCPPSLAQLVEWVGKTILLDLRIMPEFKATPLERAFQRMTTAFAPYLEGEGFRSDLKGCHAIDEDFIKQTIKRTLR